MLSHFDLFFGAYLAIDLMTHGHLLKFEHLIILYILYCGSELQHVSAHLPRHIPCASIVPGERM